MKFCKKSGKCLRIYLFIYLFIIIIIVVIIIIIIIIIINCYLFLLLANVNKFLIKSRMGKKKFNL